MLTKEQIAQRIAREIKNNSYVNLGIGIPTLVANYIPEGVNVVLQSENGLLGMGLFLLKEKKIRILLTLVNKPSLPFPGLLFSTRH